MKFLLKIAFMIIFATTIGACSYSNGRYAALSDRPITLYALTSSKKWTVKTNAEASSSQNTWFLLTLDDIPTLDNAVGQLMDAYMGDYLANVEVTRRTFHLMGIYHYTSWTVKGDVVRTYQ